MTEKNLCAISRCLCTSFMFASKRYEFAKCSASKYLNIAIAISSLKRMGCKDKYQNHFKTIFVYILCNHVG